MATLAGTLRRIDVGLLSGTEAAEWLALAGEVEQLGVRLRLLVADRAARSSVWSDEGFRTPELWMAAVADTSLPQARSTLTASGSLGTLAATRQAVCQGTLSATQARVIAEAAVKDPTREEELIDAAMEHDTGRFKSLVGDIEAAVAARVEADAASCSAPDRPETHRPRQFLRTWTDAEGLLRLAGALELADGARFVSAVRSRAVFVADEALSAGHRLEARDVYDADALVALVTGDLRQATFSGNLGAGSTTSTLVMHASLDALRRGLRGPGEHCEIDGVGPVSPALIEAWAGDAHVLLEVEDVDGRVAVADLGPAVPEHVRRALEDRDRGCVVPGCAVSVGLRTDFWKLPFGQGGPAQLWNLARLCSFHHGAKASAGWELAGGPGRWEWRPPP